MQSTICIMGVSILSNTCLPELVKAHRVPVEFIDKYLPGDLWAALSHLKTSNASPTDSQTTEKPQTIKNVRSPFASPRNWRELQQMPATNRLAVEQFKSLKINCEDLF